MSSDSATTPGCGKFFLHVEWQDCSWEPSIGRRQGGVTSGIEPTKPLPADVILEHPVGCENSARPIMNKPANRNQQVGHSSAFTLVELLLVITIIGILAGMLTVVLPAAVKRAKVMKAKTEIADIVNAIQAYDSDYSRFPVAKDESEFALNNFQAYQNDFSTGMTFGPGNKTVFNNNTGKSYDDNRQVIAILMDLQSFPNGTTSSNLAHVYNPKQIKYLNAKMSGYDPTNSIPNPPGGVDNTGIYRDPWGTPYVISMDLSYNNQCADILYALRSVSQNGKDSTAGYNGLFNPDPTNPNADYFLFHGKVMVWSAGPDKTYDPAVSAVMGKNKDNILSWQ